MKASRLVGLVVLVVGVAIVAMWLVQERTERRAAADRLAEAKGQVQRWAEKLDRQTTETGIYERHPGDQLPEDDPWGNALTVAYAQGGFAETVTVRSAGPDGALHTEDDVVALGTAVNLKGVGAGAKKNVEEFAQKGARGATKGIVEGIKESIRPPADPAGGKKDK